MDDYSENGTNDNNTGVQPNNVNQNMNNNTSDPIDNMDNVSVVDMNNVSPTTLASNDDSEEIIDFNPDEYTITEAGNIQKKGEIKKISKKALQIMREEGLTEEEYKAKYEVKDIQPASEDDVEYYVSNYDLEDYKEENKFAIDTK